MDPVSVDSARRQLAILREMNASPRVIAIAERVVDCAERGFPDAPGPAAGCEGAKPIDPSEGE
jgi:hypothetical protein